MRKAVRSGIAIAGPIPGVVPEYVEREAARFGLYRWIDWCNLSIAERLAGIAHYRMHNLIELHEGEAMNDHIAAQSAPKNRVTMPNTGGRILSGSRR